MEDRNNGGLRVRRGWLLDKGRVDSMSLATFVAPERNGGKLMLLSFIGVHFYLGNGVDL